MNILEICVCLRKIIFDLISYHSVFKQQGNIQTCKTTHYYINLNLMKWELPVIAKNSERNDECIDFTMIMTSRNNTSISNFVGGFRCKSEYAWFIIEFQKNREKQKKNDGKTRIFTQNQFSTKSIFLYGCNSKTNHCKYLKFSPNVYVSVTYIQP
ncbi:Uncharacterized protein FWK35_00011277 [Aphis craccivora]|uniref:Uncharacterized protein n=1 Tax=Aphis craccivora TaxID=307492 RepID=A0A6G0YTB1_APHCR|nr:Uncharacterized protein FWK35_00011277 [Aphis craccivora]